MCVISAGYVPYMVLISRATLSRFARASFLQNCIISQRERLKLVSNEQRQTETQSPTAQHLLSYWTPPIPVYPTSRIQEGAERRAGRRSVGRGPSIHQRPAASPLGCLPPAFLPRRPALGLRCNAGAGWGCAARASPKGGVDSSARGSSCAGGGCLCAWLIRSGTPASTSSPVTMSRHLSGLRRRSSAAGAPRETGT